MRLINSTIKRLGALGGVDIQRIENTMARARHRLFTSRGTDLVIDVGANRGQYVTDIRKSGYSGRIISFEPIPAAFELLRRASEADEKWDIRQVALGRSNTTTSFKVSENLVSSSLLDVGTRSTDAVAATRTVKIIEVEVKTMEQALNASEWGTRTHLKLDTQGSELDILVGAHGLLEKIDTIECELSLVSLYENQPLFHTVCQYLYDAGFFAVWIERGFKSKDGELLQIDALFRRDA